MITLNFTFANLTNEALDVTGSSFVVPKVVMSPIATAPLIYQGKFVHLKPEAKELDAAGSASFVDIVPTTYKVELRDQNIVSPFYIVIPTTASGVFNATSFFTGSI